MREGKALFEANVPALHARWDMKQPWQKVYTNAKVPNRREPRKGISDMNTEKATLQTLACTNADSGYAKPPVNMTP
jgi:hypothetical protein